MAMAGEAMMVVAIMLLSDTVATATAAGSAADWGPNDVKDFAAIAMQ